MPRIPDVLQQSVVFLYPDAKAAREDRRVGGTGFCVRFTHESCTVSTQCLVTNMHVAQATDRTIRIATTSGDVEFHQIRGSDWVNHPNSDDISAVVLPLKPHWKVSAIDWASLAATRLRMTELNVGAGDEVFMLGRFISHDGTQLQAPFARFGNVSMMPGPLVEDGRGLHVEAFLMEMRSLSGFSGSPVFIYIGSGTDRGNGTMMPFHSEQIGLIGIDTGHKITVASVYREQAENETELKVRLNTGVSIVAPVWKIEELLHSEALRKQQAS